MHDFLIAIHHLVTLVFHTLDMLYQSLVLVGAIGVAAQAVLGFVHGGGHGDHGGHGSVQGHAHGGDGVHVGAHDGHTVISGHSSVSQGGHAGHVAGQAHGHQHEPLAHAHREGESQGARESSSLSRLWTVFSPLTIFSFCLGMGLTGLLVRTYLTSIQTGLVATAGGFAFYHLIVRPMWGLALRFASKPAETLSGAIASEAEAMSRFDAQGRGMVRVTVDGEVKRLLALLESDDREKGIVVTPGDRLVVTSVDGKKNTCRVTRL